MIRDPAWYTMRALVCSKLGDPLATEIGKNPLDIVQNHPKPELRDRDVRIQIVAASLNFADALQVQVENLKIGFMITCNTTKSKCQCGNFSYIPLRRANTKTSRPFHLSLALRSLELSPKLGAKYAVSSRDNKYVRSFRMSLSYVGAFHQCAFDCFACFFGTHASWLVRAGRCALSQGAVPLLRRLWCQRVLC